MASTLGYTSHRRTRLALLLSAAAILVLSACATRPSPSPVERLPVSVSRYVSRDVQAAAVIGRLRESDGCLFLGTDQGRLGLSWPADTSWDPVRHILIVGGVHVSLGEVVMLGGGPFEITPGTMNRMAWVAPPKRECFGDRFWLVSDVTPDPPLPSGGPSLP